MTSNEPIQEDISVDKLRQESYTLPSGFQWDTLNLDDPLVVRNTSSSTKYGYRACPSLYSLVLFCYILFNTSLGYPALPGMIQNRY